MVSASATISFTFCYFFAVYLSVQAQDGSDLDSLINQVFTRPNQGQPSTSSPPPVTSAPGLNLQPVETHNGGNTGGDNGQNNGGGDGQNTGVGNGQNNGADDCACVAYYLCNNGTVNTNGDGVIDIRINEGPCGNQYIEVCCKTGDTVEQPITPPPSRNPTGCGYRNTKGAGFRITGANDGEAQFGEFPWMVAILIEESVEGNPLKLNVYKCGGALIGPQAVITAAHCVSARNKSFKVRAGEWDTQHEKELFPYQDREVESIIMHPQFYAGALYNDIAILILKTPLDNAEHIGYVCLPPQGYTVESGRGYATGWGKDQFGKKGKYQVILKKIDLPVVSNPTCQEKLRTTRLGRYFQLHDSFMCAGGEPGKDTCKGDGGSPLVFPISPNGGDRYLQAGIVAWGIGCGENGTPGVYAKLGKFRNWIDDQMRLNNMDTSTYHY